MTRDRLPIYPAARRYASPLERPAPRSPAWILCLGAVCIWGLVIAAGVAYFRSLA